MHRASDRSVKQRSNLEDVGTPALARGKREASARIKRAERPCIIQHGQMSHSRSTKMCQGKSEYESMK
jgi:hypothetical protein